MTAPASTTLVAAHAPYHHAVAADDAWHAELTRQYGADAGNARYDFRGRATVRLELLYQAKCAADNAARGATAAPTKAQLYHTAYTTLACAAVAAGVCVAIRYSHTNANGVDWYDLPALGVTYPAHHLTAFCL